jgi:hypothetical protein
MVNAAWAGGSTAITVPGGMCPFAADTRSSAALDPPAREPGDQDDDEDDPDGDCSRKPHSRNPILSWRGRRRLDSRAVFTVEQRDALRERLLRMADEDERIVAGAVVGSFAADGGGDRFSDLDLTFAVADHARVVDVLDDWTRVLSGELHAVALTDLQRGPTTYRVLLLPGALQCDLSMTPAAEFRPAGPRFRLLFGKTARGEPAFPAQPDATDLFGWGVIYALHARACIERGRLWQAEHYVGAVRDHALSLACLREGVIAVQARGYDDLSAETLARFDGARVVALEPGTLRTALAASVSALLREASEAHVTIADVVAERLAGLPSTRPL